MATDGLRTNLVVVSARKSICCTQSPGTDRLRNVFFGGIS